MEDDPEIVKYTGIAIFGAILFVTYFLNRFATVLVFYICRRYGVNPHDITIEGIIRMALLIVNELM